MGVVAQRHDQGQISFERTNDSTLVVQFSGPWHLQRDLPAVSVLLSELASWPDTKRLSFETAQLTHWDSGLIAFLTNTTDICRARGIAEDRAGLPAGLRRLLELAEAVPEKKGARSETAHISFFERVGNMTLGYGLSVGEFLTFLGELTLAFAKFFRGKARYRKVDLLEVIQECGPNAVGIVTLISFLVGVILAFMGAVQLSQFGASIYVADLDGIGMVRDMAAMASLAAALAIPFTTANGQPFPDRDLILFLTFAVILVTLVGQGLMLPSVIRALGLAHAGRRESHTDRAEEYDARRQATEAATERLDQLRVERHLSEDIVQPLRAQHRERLRHIDHRSDGDDGHRRLIELHDEIELLLIAAERQQINQLFRSGRLNDEGRRRIERDLDLREAHLANQRAEQ